MKLLFNTHLKKKLISKEEKKQLLPNLPTYKTRKMNAKIPRGKNLTNAEGI